MASSSLERAILLTVSYTQQFEFPLTLLEIKERLIARLNLTYTPLYKKSEVSIKSLRSVLSKMVHQKKLGTAQDYFFLPGRERSVETRLTRAAIAQQKWSEVPTFVTEAKRCPWICGIFVTGSLAMQNTTLDDDIDYMIVTVPKRLWLTRLWLTVIAWKHGKRRSWHGEEKRSWCFNLWLTRDHLDVFAQTPSLYAAYELWQAVPVFESGQVSEVLYQSNSWTQQFLPLADWPSQEPLFATKEDSGSFWLDLLEKIAYGLQWLYMKPHITRERITADWAFFHPRDTEAMVYQGLRHVI